MSEPLVTSPIKTTLYREQIWQPVADLLEEVIEGLEDLAQWAGEEGEAPAFANTAGEAVARLQHALIAAQQYRVGLLPQRPPLTGDEVACPSCQRGPGEECHESPDQKSDWRRNRFWHRERVEAARSLTYERDQQLMDVAEHLISTL